MLVRARRVWNEGLLQLRFQPPNSGSPRESTNKWRGARFLPLVKSFRKGALGDDVGASVSLKTEMGIDAMSGVRQDIMSGLVSISHQPSTAVRYQRLHFRPRARVLPQRGGVTPRLHPGRELD